jgi:hypothetical protein
MKRLGTWMTIIFLLSGAAFSQSLGDVARANRTTPKKKAARVYTNDDIPEAHLAAPVADSDAATEPKSRDQAKAEPTKDAKTDQSLADSKKPVDADTEVKARTQAYHLRAEMQKNTVALLQRELDVLQRQFEIQTTVYYSDAGTRLRNPKDWVDERKKFEDGIAAKAKELADAKAVLQSIRDEAQKASVPASAVE